MSIVQHWVALLWLFADDPGRADLEHVIDDDDSALAHRLVQFLRIAKSSVSTHQNRRDLSAFITNDHAVIQHAAFQRHDLRGYARKKPVANVDEVGHFEEHRAE